MSLRRMTRVNWDRRMSLRGNVKMGGPAVLAFLLRDIHVYHLPWPFMFRRRMSQTDAPETDDGDGGPRLMPQTDVLAIEG